ncbi:hypothetical protein AGMMS49992_23850 [Clostridia bacterium]|nr:hypothetical protein AGMMS49992_23850 [Clostridia bacterium]
MITRVKFDQYKNFREQAGCPHCRRPDVPSGDGLYWCALDAKFNPLQERIMSKFQRRFFKKKISQEELYNAVIHTAPSFYAWHCETCGRYWIENVAGQMIYENIPSDFAAAPKNDNGAIETVSSNEAMKRLVERAYGFFEDKYKGSPELASLVKNYSIFRVKADVATLNGYDRVQKIEKPLVIARDKIDEYLFNTVKESLKQKFPNRAYYQVEAQKLWTDVEEYSNTLARCFFDKMAVGFISDLFYMLKDYCSGYMRANYPREARFCLEIPDNADGWWNELYGRSVEIAVGCINSLGLNIPIIEMEKIIFGNLSVIGKGADINIIKNIVFGNMAIDIDVDQ